MNDFFENENTVEIPESIKAADTAIKPKFSLFKRLSKGKKIFFGIIALIIIAAIIFSVCIFSEISGKELKNNVSVNIPKGSTTSSVAEILKENEIISSVLTFRIYSRINGFDSAFKYGSYDFSGKCSYQDICNRLMNEGAVAPSVTVTIPEGTSINDYTKNVNGNDVTVPGIATLLERAGVCTKADFFNALNSVKFDTKLLSNANRETAYYPLEGYLFPDTYDFYNYNSEECAKLAVEKMLSQSEKMITDEMYARAKDLGYSVNEILTLASIVQLESGESSDDMADVAAVFYNRLNSEDFYSLGSSPTCYYGNSFSNDDGRYDTYKIHGLPPGPLCSAGISAIKAVLWPNENNNYYYFVTDKNGKFYYHKTDAEQRATISKLQNEGNWIYEYLN